MQQLSLILLIVLIFSHIPPSIAANLKKYEMDSSTEQQAPSRQLESDARLEEQELRIYRALSTMEEDERNKWLDTYQERFEQALSKKEMSKARFYLNIIRRWR